MQSGQRFLANPWSIWTTGNQRPNDVAVDVTCIDDDTSASNLKLTITGPRNAQLYAGSYSPRVVLNVPVERNGEQTLVARCDPATNNVSEGCIIFLHTRYCPPPLNGENASTVVVNEGARSTNQRRAEIIY